AGLNLHEGKLNIARGHLVAAAERYNELGATVELLSVYTLLAHLYLDLEKLPQALTQIALADAQLNSLNDPLAIHEAQSALRHVAARLGVEFAALWRAHLVDQPLPTWFSTTPLREAEAL